VLTRPLLDELARLGRPVHHRRGERLVRAGDRPGVVVVITRGVVKVVTSSVAGVELIVALRGPGDLIGEFSVLSGTTAWATVEVLEDVEGCAVAAPMFLDFARAHPDLLVAQLQRVILALRQSDSKRLEMATLDLQARVARSLLELRRIRAAHGTPVIALPVTQDELASLCGASREAVSRVLRTFREEGWIRTERRAVTIEDLGALCAAAGVSVEDLDRAGPLSLH
jgi:CRP/FNR family cyclic AMP-dependent transcriptional regulator